MNKAQPRTILTDYDITLLQGGTHVRLYQKMGAHPAEQDGRQGIAFAVYAPAAKCVSVIGDFNRWLANVHDLYPKWDSSGVWEGFIPGLQPGAIYKYAIESHNGMKLVKADPYARMCEHPPMTASVIWDDAYTWNDEAWMKTRGERNRIGAPVSTYEMHLASWRRHGDGKVYTYRQLAEVLPEYLSELGFTHVEFMPIMEHPYDPSWGYQITGFFAPTCRFGTPDDLRYLIDKLHQHNIGVILDWVPSHFPTDAHGLGNFDGSCVYEHPDTRKGFHPDWQSLIFNYGRNEVKSFLLSNALFWIDEFHVDGLRVDAVASMIYLDYSRKEGEWVPNEFGGNENLEAIAFLKAMNEMVYHYHPDILTIAEESTAFAGVSHPTYAGGLGFGMKWMMGWMHDTLNYFKLDPLFRKSAHNQITFSMIYAYSENYVLPYSHDEVVHGKGSLLSRMPGEGKDQFANLRLMLGHMFLHPGAKLLFMGCEFGQRSEWSFAGMLEWIVLQYESHQGILEWVKSLNHLYKNEKSLHEADTKPEGFKWVRVDDWQQSVLAYERIANDENDKLLMIMNMTPVDRAQYRIGLESGSGEWNLIENSDKNLYWGSDRAINDKVKIEDLNWEHKNHSMEFNLPGLTCLIYRWIPGGKKVKAKGIERKAEVIVKIEKKKKHIPPHAELLHKEERKQVEVLKGTRGLTAKSVVRKKPSSTTKQKKS
ncbi:MAG: 1,4-alpha-glucan branching protein GlgB [Saprospiraceae bacterium]